MAQCRVAIRQLGRLSRLFTGRRFIPVQRAEAYQRREPVPFLLGVDVTGFQSTKL
jgi:hypothetical protein